MYCRCAQRHTRREKPNTLFLWGNPNPTAFYPMPPSETVSTLKKCNRCGGQDTGPANFLLTCSDCRRSFHHRPCTPGLSLRAALLIMPRVDQDVTFHLYPTRI